MTDEINESQEFLQKLIYDLGDNGCPPHITQEILKVKKLLHRLGVIIFIQSQLHIAQELIIEKMQERNVQKS